jgi:ankyrin repeat protein
MATDTIIAMDSASVVATGPAAARDRAQKTLRQARAACRLTRLPAWAAAAAAALPAVVDGDATCAASPRRPAPVDQESWSVFVRHLGIHIQGLLGVRELILLAITNRSLKHMLSDELDSKCSVWNRCCANETSFNTARIMSAAAKNGKNRYLSCMLQDPHCQLVLQRKKRVLFAAVQHSNEDAVAMLLSGGANVNARDKKGEMPLLKAIEKENLNIVEMLLKQGADVHSEQNGTLPLHMAAYHRSTSMVNLLLQHGAPVNARDSSSGATALHDACNGCGCGTHGHRDAQSVVVLEQLLQEGIDINVVDRKGRSALYFACARGDGAAAKILLSKGADVDAAFRIARSCIMYVSSSSYDTHVSTSLTSTLRFVSPGLGNRRRSNCCGVRSIHCTMRAHVADSRTSKVSCARATWM